MAASPASSTLLARVTVLLSDVPGPDLVDDEARWVHGLFVWQGMVATTAQNLDSLRRRKGEEPFVWAFGEVSIGPKPFQGLEIGRDDASGVVLVGLEGNSQFPVPAEAFSTALPEPGTMFELLRLEPPGTPSPFPWLAQFTGVATVGGRTRLVLHPQAVPPLPAGMEAVPLVWNEQVVGIVASDTTDRSTGERQLLAVPFADIMSGPLGETIRRQYDGQDGEEQNALEEPPVKEAPPIGEDDEALPDGITVPDVSLDGDALLHRMGQRARRALATADAIRTRLHDPVLSTVHLIAGLYTSGASDLKERLTAAGIDADGLGRILHEAGHRDVHFDETYPPVELEELPACSRNVRFALATAFQAAAGDDSQDVESQHLLAGLLSARGSAVVRALLVRGVRPPAAEEVTPPRVSIPGFRPDAITDKDLLGIGNDVEALASLLAARDVTMPLSIGLFGEWGSGKSFFMEQMRTRIDRLVAGAATDARPGQRSPYCAAVVQLEFNAWHYVDTDLWASLADEIFEGLARKIDLARLPADVKDHLELEREQLAAGIVKKRQELNAAERALAAQATNLQTVTQEAEAERRAVDALVDAMTPSLVMQGSANVLVRQDEVQKQLQDLRKKANDKIDEAAAALNLPSGELSTEAARRRVLEVRGFGDALLLAVTSPRDRRHWGWVIGAALAVVLTILLLGAAQNALAPYVSAIGASLATIVGAGIAFLVGAGVVMRPYLLAARRVIGLIWEIRAESTRLAEQEREERLKSIKQRQEEAESKVSKARQTVDTRRKEVGDLERELESLRADRRLREFVKRRHTSEDYRRLRGVIGQARSDFEQLDVLLRQERSRAAQDGELLPTLDRIVLYIDDLDRCGEKEVMDVLQAVHLLLAFPLFAVVVAVDPRWLLYSVRQHSAAFRDDGHEANDGLSDEERAHWRSTPMNYLEKVFQIPFTLRPMGTAGFGKMVDALAAPLDGSSAGAPPVAANAATPPPLSGRPETEGGHLPGGTGTLPELPERRATPSDPAVGERVTVGQADPVGRTPAPDAETITPAPATLGTRHLEIELHERQYMKRLHELIPSPRAAKRFVNVYRLLKAKAEPNAERFEQLTLQDGGDYRAVLLLLAILTGYPEQATEILSALIRSSAGGEWWVFLEQFRPRSMPPAEDQSDEDVGTRRQAAARWATLFEILDRYRRPVSVGVQPLLPEHEPCAAFVRWAPQVARYSFQSGRVLLSG